MARHLLTPTMAALRDELEHTIARGYALVAQGLVAVGAPPSQTGPVVEVSFEGLWAEYRAIWRQSALLAPP